jgi:hypothetical protein
MNVETDKATHSLLAEQGIRLFNVSLGGDTTTWIHVNKTVEQWRTDVLQIIAELGVVKSDDVELCAADEAFNRFQAAMNQRGYCDVSDVVSDCFEGEIVSRASAVQPDSLYELQPSSQTADGFGHYGWEAAGGS